MPASTRIRNITRAAREPLLITLSVIAVFWKIALTRQYTFLESPDHANQILPWLDVQVNALRNFTVLLWDPYEAAGESLLGQVQPGVLSPFTWLLALTPLDAHGHLQILYVNLWFVLIHVVAALFAFALFRDFKCRRGPALIGAVFYGTGGYIGNISWPQVLTAAVWAPLVFFFLLRSLRGQRPMRNAAAAGAVLGLSWLSGHHVPSLYLSLAAFGTVSYYFAARALLRPVIARRVFVTAFLTFLVSAPQIISAVEYGRSALRWTGEGIYTWNQRVPIREHEQGGLNPKDLIHVLIPGGNSLIADPFAGAVALSLASLAVTFAFSNWRVRLFCAMGVIALLLSMPRTNVLYGVLYSLVPIFEKAREPMEAIALFHLSLAALVAIGANVLLTSEGSVQYSAGIGKLMMWFGVITFALYSVRIFLNLPGMAVDGDPRILVIGLLALFGAALYRASQLGLISRNLTMALLVLLIVIEQGNEVGYWSFAARADTQRSIYLKPVFETEDVGDFLRQQSNPKRIEVNLKDVPFSFGDWNRVDSMAGSGASLPMNFQLLEPWSDRVSRLFGAGYAISRTPIRPHQREVFHDGAGYKVFVNPDAFPRAWTVHQVKRAANELWARELTAHGNLDLRSVAVTTGESPLLETCRDPDRVSSIDERPMTANIVVEMKCRGMLVIGDNWFPGWHASVDGKTAPILRVDSAIRGIVVERGTHRVAMAYRPLPIYFAIVLSLIGVIGTVLLQRRKESDGVDVVVPSQPQTA